MRQRNNECSAWPIIVSAGIVAVIAGGLAGIAAGTVYGANAGSAAAEEGISNALRRQEIHNALHQNDPLKRMCDGHLFEDAEIVYPQ